MSKRNRKKMLGITNTKPGKRNASTSSSAQKNGITTTSSATNLATNLTQDQTTNLINISNSEMSISSSLSQARKIKFKPTIQIREYEVRKLKNEGCKKSSLFYTNEEYEQMEAANTRVVELILQKQQQADSHQVNSSQSKTILSTKSIERQLGDTDRGLEKMTPRAWDGAQDRRAEARAAVLQEQTRQRQSKTYDPEEISKVYSRTTLKSKHEASDAALRDERFISQEFGPLEPIGMKLTSESTHCDNKVSEGRRSSNEQNSKHAIALQTTRHGKPNQK